MLYATLFTDKETINPIIIPIVLHKIANMGLIPSPTIINNTLIINVPIKTKNDS